MKCRTYVYIFIYETRTKEMMFYVWNLKLLFRTSTRTRCAQYIMKAGAKSAPKDNSLFLYFGSLVGYGCRFFVLRVAGSIGLFLSNLSLRCALLAHPKHPETDTSTPPITHAYSIIYYILFIFFVICYHMFL